MFVIDLCLGLTFDILNDRDTEPKGVLDTYLVLEYLYSSCCGEADIFPGTCHVLAPKTVPATAQPLNKNLGTQAIEISCLGDTHSTRVSRRNKRVSRTFS